MPLKQPLRPWTLHIQKVCHGDKHPIAAGYKAGRVHASWPREGQCLTCDTEGKLEPQALLAAVGQALLYNRCALCRFALILTDLERFFLLILVIIIIIIVLQLLTELVRFPQAQAIWSQMDAVLSYAAVVPTILLYASMPSGHNMQRPAIGPLQEHISCHPCAGLSEMLNLSIQAYSA